MSAPLLSRVKSELSPRHAICSLDLPSQPAGPWKVDQPVAASIPASVVAVVDPSVTGVVIYAVDTPKKSASSANHRQSESALRQLKVAHCSADQRLLAMQWSHSETQPVLALLLLRDPSSPPSLVLHGHSDQTASVATTLPSPFPCSASAPSAGLSLWWGARQGHSLIGVTSIQGAVAVFNAAGQLLWQHSAQGPHHSVVLDPSLSILSTQSGSAIKGLPLPDSILQGLEPPTNPVHAGWAPHSALQCTAAAHGGFFVTSAVRRSDSQVSALTVLDLSDVSQPSSRSFQFPIEYGVPVTHHLLPSLLLAVTSGGLLLAMSPQTGSIAYRLQLTAPDHPFETLPLSASHRWDPSVSRVVTFARVNPLQPQLIAVVWDQDDVQIIDVNDWARVHLSFPLVTAALMTPSASVTSVEWCCGGHALLVKFETGSSTFARVYPVPDLACADPAVVSCTLHAFPVFLAPHFSTATIDPLSKTLTVPALLPRLRFQDIAAASTTTGPATGSVAPVPNACLRLVTFPAPSRTAQTVDIPLNVDPVSEASLSALLPTAESKLSEDLKASVALTERLVAFVRPSSDLAAYATEAARLVLPRWQPRRLLIILNPFAGKRQGKEVLKAAMPIFEAAGLAITVVETKDCNTATETAKTMDIEAFDAIVCVSGDSTVTQIINGLYARADRDRALKMPVSLLPAGSSNALAVSFDALQPEVTALRIVRGETRLLDMFRLKHGSTDRLVLVDVAFGIVGDVNAKSERLRWMGPVRYDVSGVLGILKLKPYRCAVSYLPPSAEQLALRARVRTVGSVPVDTDETAIKNGAAALEIKCRPNCQYCEQMQAIVKYESEAKLAGAEAREDEWVKLPADQEWLSIFSCNQSWVTKTMQFTPYAHMSDGLIDVVLSRHSSKMAALKLFTALPSAAHIQDEECFYLQARAFRLEGMYPQKAKLNIDGEVLDLEGDHPLIVEVLPSFCTYLGGW